MSYSLMDFRHATNPYFLSSLFFPRGMEYVVLLVIVPNYRIRYGSPDVPVRIRGRVVQVDVRDAAIRSVVRVATANRHTRHTTYPNLLFREKVLPLAALRLQFTLSRKWFARHGSPDGPGRIRGRAAQVDGRDAAIRSDVRAATANRHTSAAVVKIKIIAVMFC